MSRTRIKYRVQASTYQHKTMERFFTSGKLMREHLEQMQMGEDDWWIVYDSIGRKVIEKDNGTVTYADWWDVPKVLQGLK